MKKRSLIPVAIVVITTGILARNWLQKSAAPLKLEYSTKTAFASKGAAMIPWRDPAKDIQKVFPGAPIPDAGNPTVIALSGHRLALIKKLGKLDSNALFVHVIKDKGVALLRRAKGQSGAIEVVVFVSQSKMIAGIAIQRHREPNNIATRLGAPSFVNAFKGLTAESTFPTFPDKSLQAVSDVIRALLVEYDAGSHA
jgi:hypothetical protein